MTPVGKIVKLLLAVTVAGVLAAGLAGCKKDEPASAPPQAEAPKAQAQAPKAEEPKAQAQPTMQDGARVVELQVTPDGYVPSPITLKQGEPVLLKVTRTTDQTCATELIMDEYGINQELPLNKTVEIKFTPEKTGELKYGCHMGKMISGRFLIE